MKWCKTERNLTQLLTCLLVVSFGLMGCGSGTTGDSGAVTPQGTINLEQLKVGVPQKVLEDAVLTFEIDENPISKVGGKTQFLSRTKDTKNGKFLAQCLNGYCYKLQGYYLENPITKDEAISSLKGMLPSSSPEQSRVDDSQLKDGKTERPVELYYFGKDYLGELIYSDKTGEKVSMVNVIDLKRQSIDHKLETEKTNATNKVESESDSKTK